MMFRSHTPDPQPTTPKRKTGRGLESLQLGSMVKVVIQRLDSMVKAGFVRLGSMVKGGGRRPNFKLNLSGLRLAPILKLLVAILLVVGVVSGFKKIGKNKRSKKESHPVSLVAAEHNFEVERQRLCRNQIPKLDLQTINYRALFDDLNDIQLEVATRNGLKHPEDIDDPAQCDQLVLLESNQYYRIDSMSYSKPYLIPEAVLLLRYIGIRFQEVMKENYPKDKHHYRLVVTSALRSEEDVSRLRRRNRNATEKSCHRFGTTLDISYIRFECDGKEDVNELFLKNMLALTLYELRQEGLCYVKYERGQSCFHLTVRNTEYKGKKKSTTETYVDSAGVTLGPWGDDGTLTATEALTREFRQHGTIHGKTVEERSSKSTSSKKTKSSSKSKPKGAPDKKQANTQPPKAKSDHYRDVPAAGRSGEEGIVAW